MLLMLQKKKIVIFYGSQTGTAEDYGTRIAKEAKVSSYNQPKSSYL